MKKTLVVGAAALLTMSPAPAFALSSMSSFPGSSVITAPEVPEPEPEEVYEPRYNGEQYQIADQGDRLWGTVPNEEGNISGCTAGYVNKAEREVWTSAHCYEMGEEVTVDGVVFGTVTKEGDYVTGGTYRGGDWAIITLTPEAALGVNGHSGDNIDYSPQNGDAIKIYGATTKTVVDSTIVRLVGGHISYCPTGADGGDSGGPVWSEDGLVGLHSGRGNYPGGCAPTRNGYATLATGIN